MGSQRHRLYLSTEADRAKSWVKEAEPGDRKAGHAADSRFGGEGSPSRQDCGRRFEASLGPSAGIHHLPTRSCSGEAGGNDPQGARRRSGKGGSSGRPATQSPPPQPGRGIRCRSGREGDGRPLEIQKKKRFANRSYIGGRQPSGKRISR